MEGWGDFTTYDYGGECERPACAGHAEEVHQLRTGVQREPTTALLWRLDAGAHHPLERFAPPLDVGGVRRGVGVFLP